MTKMTPTKEQERIITDIRRDDSGGTLFAGQMGVGKTLVATEVARRIGARRILIAAPKSTFGFARDGKYDGWIGTLARQYPTIKIKIVKKRSDITNDDGVFLIGREMVAAITKDTKKEKGVKWSKIKPFDLFIYDEVHFIGNRKSKAYAAVKTIVANKKIGLSGTPFRTKFDNIWSVCRFLWPLRHDVISQSYWVWRYEHCEIETKHFGQQKIERVIGEKDGRAGQFVLSLPSYFRLTAPTRAVHKNLYVELTPAQRRAYREMEDHSVAWLNDNPVVATIPIVQRIRLREMTLGLPRIDVIEGKPVIEFDEGCSSAKLTALEDYLIGHEGPLLVFTHSQKFAVVAAKRLKAALWTGKSSDKERAQAKADFLDGKKQILVATPRSFGTGTDGLQHVCDTVVFLSRDDSDTDNLQAIARLDRSGQKSANVSVIDIVAVDTFDEGDLSKEAQAVLNMHMSLTS